MLPAFFPTNLSPFAEAIGKIWPASLEAEDSHMGLVISDGAQVHVAIRKAPLLALQNEAGAPSVIAPPPRSRRGARVLPAHRRKPDDK
jgi:hypothetical protein